MVQKILDTTAAAAEATAAPELVKANAEFEHIHGEVSSFHTPMDEFFAPAPGSEPCPGRPRTSHGRIGGRQA